MTFFNSLLIWFKDITEVNSLDDKFTVTWRKEAPLCKISNTEWTFVEDWEVTVVDDIGLPFNILIRKGFKTNLASIPFPFSKIWNRDDKRWKEASAFHDFLYRTHWTNDRRECDIMFVCAMKNGGSPRAIRSSFYIVVRTFGSWLSSWNRKH